MSDGGIEDVLGRLDAARKLTAGVQSTHRKERAARRARQTTAAQARMKKQDPVGFAEYRARADTARRAVVKSARERTPAPDYIAADVLAWNWLSALEFKCEYCGREIAVDVENRTVDHFVPLSKGGLHTPENLRRACRSCNSRKKWAGTAARNHRNKTPV